MYSQKREIVKKLHNQQTQDNMRKNRQIEELLKEKEQKRESIREMVQRGKKTV
jgi:hypothetical protein